MPPSSGELWGYHLMPTKLDVDILLPSGALLILECSRDTTLEKIKRNVWREAKLRDVPLMHQVGPPSNYIFFSVTQDGDSQEFYDETRRLCDLRLFHPVLKLIEPIGNKDEVILNSEIGKAVGIYVHEFDGIKDLELLTFRRDVVDVCTAAIAQRDQGDITSRLQYAFPPDIDPEPKLPKNLSNALHATGDQLLVCVWVMSNSREKQKYTVKVDMNCKPDEVIASAIRKSTRTKQMTRDQQEQCVLMYTSTYVLKVCGCQTFIMADYPISQYKYIRHCIARGTIPQLMLMNREAVHKSLSGNDFTRPSYLLKIAATLKDDETHKRVSSLWDINDMLKVRIKSAQYVSARDIGKIYVKTGIYHATEALSLRDTKMVDISCPQWLEWLNYDLYIPDIPRSSKLCVSLCCVSKKQKRKVEYCIAWGNLNLFDYKDRLIKDSITFSLWPTPRGFNDLIHPIGMPGPNPNKDSPCVVIEFEHYKNEVLFPDETMYERWLEDNQETLVHRHGTTNQEILRRSDESLVSEEILLPQLHELSQRDSLSDITEQEKNTMWRNRKLCMKVPEILPKMLFGVRWSCRGDVAQLYSLLREWPIVSPMTALQLLYCSYSDPVVRRFAVYCLKSKLTDSKLAQFLLQLVQVLKFEPYVDNALTRFLLTRSILNQKIGHFFFWHLKSEMHNISIRMRFGVILEAYCRSCGSYVKSLSRQVEALEKLTILTDSLKQEKDDDQLKVMSNQVSQPDFLEALQNFPSPLASEYILGKLRINECKVMSSKKRPLNLTWENLDPMAEFFYNDFKIIFKNGDDLRQDMLTLQVIRIMDDIWQSEGLDLRMLPYGCLATGPNVGMIEVVRNAQTVMNILKQDFRAAMQVRCKELHRWIKDKNTKNYETAIDSFTRSCAGYCVATFVLGIGDRNPDNIMVNEEGQLFHIDYGHFLDHRKKKFGINRERVPFVLTEDFIQVIAKGADNPLKSQEFASFMELCGKAYVHLHNHADVFITLFSMMLSCGIPELQSLDDISYIRKTLAVESDAVDALRYFQTQLSQAHGGGWTTKLDWFFHYVKHRN